VAIRLAATRVGARFGHRFEGATAHFRRIACAWKLRAHCTMATSKSSRSKKTSRSRKYGTAAKKSVKSALHRAKRGTLKAGSGRHPKAKSRKQAIAIGLSEARKKGAKVPRRKSS